MMLYAEPFRNLYKAVCQSYLNKMSKNSNPRNVSNKTYEVFSYMEKIIKVKKTNKRHL